MTDRSNSLKLARQREIRDRYIATVLSHFDVIGEEFAHPATQAAMVKDLAEFVMFNAAMRLCQVDGVERTNRPAVHAVFDRWQAGAVTEVKTMLNHMVDEERNASK